MKSIVFSILTCTVIAYTVVSINGDLDFDWEEGEVDESGGLIQVKSILGENVDLPCDIESPIKDHRVYIVLWFKENIGKPIYSFDVRGRSFGTALRWSDASVFGSRASFVAATRHAYLRLENVQLQDEGIYRCRVDFKNAPTRNFQINLTIIVPAHQMIIYDGSGREISSTVGPLTEGSDLNLICEVRGGKPTPLVSWYINKNLVESTLEDVTSYVDKKVVISKLSVQNLQRQNMNITFTCKSSNSDMIQPQRKFVTLLMHLKPLFVRILEKPTWLTEKEEKTFTCESSGSIPDAQLSWRIKDKYFHSYKMNESTSGRNETIVRTEFSYVPTPEDDGNILRCRAENPNLPNSAIEDSVMLNIRYVPILVLRLGNSLNPDKIKEGDDVYFECDIRSNPAYQKIEWFHQERLVIQNMTAGIIISGQSLVLQGITYLDSGNYTCEATNEVGSNISNSVYLRVQYAPRCSTKKTLVVAASLEKVLHATCNVEADPDDVNFSWQFNNSEGDSFLVSSSIYRKLNKTSSELAYITSSSLDYGTLMCRADNAIGRQKIPCTFRVVSASEPSSLQNCTLQTLENRPTWLKIVCIPGYTESLSQQYHLDIVQNNNLLLNVTSHVPTFLVDVSALNAIEFSSLLMYVYSANASGKSDVIVLTGNQSKDARMKTENANVKENGETSNKSMMLTVLVVIIALSITSLVLLLFHL